MGMDAFFTPAIIKSAAAVMGLEAGRLDYDEQTHQLFGTIVQRGRVHTFSIPTGRTYTRDEICALLTGRPRAIAGEPDPWPAITGESPP